ncbi:hypothetical protein, partial [Sphingobacterium daejeonense]|uniref:hypothetical protein n=1 Tax=Sphingobacterium daejeonense TaxID=371142 RepID=UPI003D314975
VLPSPRFFFFLFLCHIPDSLKLAVQLYYEFYSRQQGQMQSATFSLVDMGEMGNLAKAMREVIEKHPGTVVPLARVPLLSYSVLS